MAGRWTATLLRLMHGNMFALLVFLELFLEDGVGSFPPLHFFAFH